MKTMIEIFKILRFFFTNHTFHINILLIFFYSLWQLFRSIRLKSEYPIELADRIDVNNEGKMILQRCGEHFTTDCTPRKYV